MSKQGEPRLKHGLSKHPLYPTWNSMMDRCYNNRSKNFQYWGAKGITVYGPWHSVAQFVEDISSSLGPKPKGWTLDRIDPAGNYEPSNVRWATVATQNANRRFPRRTPCGTQNGYSYHRYHGEPRCDACWKAHAEDVKRRRLASERRAA